VDALARLLGRIEAFGVGPRVLKTALAAGLAWWLGNLYGEPLPVFAAIVAIVCLEPTVIASLTKVGEELGGIIGGLVVAGVALRLSGSAPLTIFLLILISMALGVRLRMRQAVTVELAITALLVVAYTDPTNPYYGAHRIVEAAIGGAVAVAVNALVLPPEYLGQVSDLFERLVELNARALELAFDDVAGGVDAETAGDHLSALRLEAERLAEERQSLGRARDALRFSPLRRHRRDALERYARGVETAGRLAGHGQGALRIAWQHARREAHTTLGTERLQPLITVRDAAVAALDTYADYIRSDDAHDLDEARLALERAQQARAAFLLAAERHLEQAITIAVEDRVDVAALETELEHVLDDLEVAVRAEAAGRTARAAA
jgi:uncharacterized membrane protein YgaE (UPF0421/DUF939 family)